MYLSIFFFICYFLFENSPKLDYRTVINYVEKYFLISHLFSLLSKRLKGEKKLTLLKVALFWFQFVFHFFMEKSGISVSTNSFDNFMQLNFALDTSVFCHIQALSYQGVFRKYFFIISHKIPGNTFERYIFHLCKCQKLAREKYVGEIYFLIRVGF